MGNLLLSLISLVILEKKSFEDLSKIVFIVLNISSSDVENISNCTLKNSYYQYHLQFFLFLD